MIFDWDGAKSAKVKAERGASFEDLAEAIELGPLDIHPHPRISGQLLYVVALGQEIWVVVVEERESLLRIVTAYPSRKWRKHYDT